MKRSQIFQESPATTIIFASTLVAVMGVSLISPVLPAVQEAWNITEAQASLLLSAFTLPGVFLTIPIGIVIDRIGRKRIFIPSLVIFGLSGAGVVLLSSFEMILVLRAIQGAASSAIATLTVTLIGDLYTGEKRRTLIGMNAVFLAVGAAGYPLLGGALATLSWMAPFICFLLGVVVALPGIVFLEEPSNNNSGADTSIREFVTGAAPMKPYLVLYTAIFGIFLLLYGAQLTVVPFILANSYEYSSGVIGLLLGLPAVTMGLTAMQGDRLLQSFSSFQSIALGFTSYGIGLVIVSMANSVYTVAGALLLFGVGQGLAEPITDTALNELAPDEFRGSIMSIRTSVLRLGTTIGPPVFVGLATIVGYAQTLLIGGGAALLVGVGWLLVRGSQTSRVVVSDQ
ncbi:Predicted arabinose efflux permease, MFS family [Haladaptatus litoreus]|uniref:Predicted arabinose efflux permease, MFS family n=1 Tax=Haladaptatus litoreus TaxID=553468 RepID=A0A1N7FB44_9EURY|nr:MFS transporter [Haladaptatus litoreus]SIR97539.1 Predicted arabinose efflux permease, MFS family [Haladaptatus litoreus]